MISDLLRTALTAISPNRSQDSWIAGSSVLSHFIERVPNDIDIHHVSLAALEDAVDRDTRALAEVGFSIASRRTVDTDLEIVFFGSDGNLAIDWVLEQERPKAMIDDPLFGKRASYADVIARKIKMHLNDDHSKHRDDLLALLPHSASMAAEISPNKLVAELSNLGVAACSHAGARSGGRRCGSQS